MYRTYIGREDTDVYTDLYGSAYSGYSGNTESYGDPYASRGGGYTGNTDLYDDVYSYHRGIYAEDIGQYADTYRSEYRRYPEDANKYRTHTRRNPEGIDKYRTRTRWNREDTNKYCTRTRRNPEDTDKYRTHRRRNPGDTEKYNSRRQQDQGNQGTQAGAIKYKHVKNIGAGGQGECKLVERASDGQRLVLKKMRNPLLSGVIPTEARVLGKVLPPCPRVIKFHQAILQPPEAQIFFDYCDGGDLHGLIDNYTRHGSVIPEAFIWHVFVQLAEALAFIHYGVNVSERHAASKWDKVIHRDVKPSNIFLKSRSGGKYPHVILGDFGLAAVATDPDYRSICHNGTPSWRAPELPEATSRSDVWAIGAIIHAMAHKGKSPLKPMPKTWPNDERHRSKWELDPSAREPWSIDHLYSSTLQKWMLTALQADPRHRPTSLELVKKMIPESERRSKDRYKPLKAWALDPC